MTLSDLERQKRGAQFSAGSRTVLTNSYQIRLGNLCGEKRGLGVKPLPSSRAGRAQGTQNFGTSYVRRRLVSSRDQNRRSHPLYKIYAFFMGHP